MTRTDPSDDALRDAYEQLLQRRSAHPEPAISLEVIRALAEGSYIGSDLTQQLERVLAHPHTAHEFHVLRAVAAERRTRPRRLPVWLGVAAAAAVVVMVVSRTMPNDDTLRSGSVVEVITPDEGRAWGAGSFVWHAARDVAAYHFEVLNADAAIVDSLTTTDTMVVRPMPTDSSRTPWSWSVAARRRDGSLVRSAPRQVVP